MWWGKPNASFSTGSGPIPTLASASSGESAHQKSNPIPTLASASSGESAHQINSWWENRTDLSVGFYPPEPSKL